MSLLEVGVRMRLTSVRSLLFVSLTLLLLMGGFGCESSDHGRPSTQIRAAYPDLRDHRFEELQLPPLVCAAPEGCPPAVGEIVFVGASGQTEFCTASLVRPTIVMTASHCISWENVNSHQKFNGNCWVRWPSDGNGNAPSSIPCSAVAHATKLRRAYSNEIQSDIAFIRLAQRVDREPLHLLRGVLPSSRENPEVEVYGIHLGTPHQLTQLTCRRDDNLRLRGFKSRPGESLVLPGCGAELGFSGGPLMNSETGEVLGVMSFIENVPPGHRRKGTSVGTRVSFPDRMN